MKTIKGKMFSDSGVKIQLSDLLKQLPENDWIWCIYEFEGIGIAPYGLSIPEFEELVLSKETGLVMSWEEVKKLAASLNDIISCTLAAVISPVLYDSLENNDLSNCLVLLRVFDSTSWEINYLTDN